ncbi:hypothetical protein GCM10023169_12780 [Georgenia halophila]|uniref:Uncharacterized protein n=1 Tax=Georgenia halophila TaxID=620889 RepID=A0ABP8KVA2_9MICO
MSATDGDDEGVLDDLSMPPWWHFVGGGAATALGVMAFRHLALFVPACLLFAVLALLERRGGYPHQRPAS